jgi:hypothetical protein
MRTFRLVTVIMVALLVGACGDDDTTTADTSATTSTVPDGSTTTADSTTTTTEDPVRHIEIVVTGGQVVGGVQRERVSLGEPVLLSVTSDVADEVHVHGYDLKEDVAAGGTAEIEFTADLAGVWEVELEHSKVQLVELEVS